MPQPVNNRKREQWQSCDRCGRLFPMSRLVKQKGLLICTNSGICFDDLIIERRAFMIMEVLGQGGTENIEGADLRVVDRGFFEGFDEVER